MSSPLASLSKTRKVPLESVPVNPGRQGTRICRDEDEVDMLNEGHGLEKTISVPSCYGSIGASVSRQALPTSASAPGLGSRDFVHLAVPVFHDSELMTSMARKLRDLEQQVKAQSNEILSKDQKILALEDLVQNLQQNQGEVNQQRQVELEATCMQLQRQVGEMEFLSDYGLHWVGELMDQEDSEDKIISENDERDWMTAKKFWKPGDSLVLPEVDFDRLLASLQDLSELVVEGDTQVKPVPGGARFHVLEPIPLKLYRNGIMMFDGPFRPFCDPSTQRCLRDILDGFFPSELQRLYPDGVPFKVSDLRNQVYPEDGLGPFPGEGRVVGQQSMFKASDRVEEYPGPSMTAEKFLNRLPKCVIRQGEVIDIRGPMRDSLQVRPALISPGDFITNPGPACSVLSRGTGEGEDREESLELCYNFWVTVELVSALCWAPEGCQVDCKWGKVKVQVGARGEPQGPGMSLRHSPGCPFLIVLQAPHLTPHPAALPRPPIDKCAKLQFFRTSLPPSSPHY
ncbi:UBX domain-containing protein 11 isoform X3 [Castor canadensis]|uniref:UBX domain-containing protein 11 isoform X3 n=1 Tax=Castor canadensis TaxID=51338 RepID=A0AC58N5W3_CASCN